VIVRGIEQGSIVRDDTDRKTFIDRMGLLAKGSDTEIYAFALMTNHAHILLKSGPDGISKYMRCLLTGYAQYYNRRHKRAGHLFQNRYKSIICEEEAYFDKLVAYIHLNPLRAGLVETLQQLADYPWSGHAVLMNKVRYDWMDRYYVLKFFGRKEGTARKAYLLFLESEMGIDREQELSGGGLIRSQGGWTNVQSMRKRGEKALGDERILGGDDFVQGILNEVAEREDSALPVNDRLRMLDEDIRRLCEAEGVTLAFLHSGSRMGKLPKMRKQLARKAVFEYGLTLVETAKRLGVTPNAVNYMLKDR
jgi:REP element-mobilizing transposase RayT